MRSFHILLILLAGVIVGCSDDNKSTGPDGGGPTSGFTGLFVTGSASGKMVLTISSATLAGRIRPLRAASVGAHRVDASATITPTGGSSINLIGFYSDEEESLYVAGPNYTLIGHYDDSETPPSFTGSVTSTGGDGIFGCFLGGTTTVKIYCGTYESTSGPAAGSWNMVSIDTSLVGVAFPAGGSASDLITFDGTIERTGTTRAIAFTGGDPGVLDLTGTGTYDTVTTDVSGGWVLDDVTDVNDDGGTWMGKLCP